MACRRHRRLIDLRVEWRAGRADQGLRRRAREPGQAERDLPATVRDPDRVVNATGLVAAVGNAAGFRRRDLAAWLGPTPREHATGGKQRLFGHLQAGQQASACASLIHGARAALPHLMERRDALGHWLRGGFLCELTVTWSWWALPTSLARMAWAVLMGDPLDCLRAILFKILSQRLDEACHLLFPLCSNGDHPAQQEQVLSVPRGRKRNPANLVEVTRLIRDELLHSSVSQCALGLQMLQLHPQLGLSH